MDAFLVDPMVAPTSPCLHWIDKRTEPLLVTTLPDQLSLILYLTLPMVIKPVMSYMSAIQYDHSESKG